LSELNQGQPADNAIPVPVVDTSAPVEAPTQVESAAPQPVLPAKYAGKSAEDLAKMLEDQEKMIGRQAAEVGELRQKSSNYEQWLAQIQLQQAQQQAQAAPPVAPVDDEPSKFDWENPDKAVDRRVERKLRSELDVLRRQMVMETAASQAPIAKNMAKTMYPDAFKGVTDDELDRAMYGGAAAGNVQPQNLTKPEAWRMLGWILQGEKNNYRMGGGITPVSPTATETPMSAKPQTYGNDERPILDDQARSILKGMGMDEETYLKNRREEQRGR